ncbi:ankyrin repeat-containing domain protein [Xylaria sp. FL1777]|nr:ankyrin repeat-containing domain protein [Xylaria sp. FL1777]
MNFRAVELLLSHPSIKVNLQSASGYTPLHLAARQGNLDIVKLLLSHPSIDVNLQCPSGYTPLLQSLSAYTPLPQSPGCTPLQLATQQGNLDIVKLLLSHPSIDVNLPDMGGIVPFLSAVNFGSPELVRLFLQDARTDRTWRCSKGRSALDYAKLNRNPEVLKLVKEFVRAPLGKNN